MSRAEGFYIPSFFGRLFCRAEYKSREARARGLQIPELRRVDRGSRFVDTPSNLPASCFYREVEAKLLEEDHAGALVTRARRAWARAIWATDSALAYHRLVGTPGDARKSIRHPRHAKVKP
jgi:hypothetical protein